MNVAGIDVGYNNVKSKASNGRKAYFPAEVGTEQQATFSLEEAKHQGLVVTMADDQVWYVGNTAIQQSVYSAGRRDPDWLNQPSYQVLLAAALSEMYKVTTKTRVVTGLPLELYNAWADPMKDVFNGEHRFRRRGRNFQTVTIEETVVVTQPYGTLLDLALADNGAIQDNLFATQTVGIADIGGMTLNLLVADALEEVGRWTAGDGLGLLKALDTIGRAIREDFPRFSPRTREVSQWVTAGSFPYQGQSVDITPYAQPALRPVAQTVLNKMTEVWDEPGRYAVVVLTGGGALALGPILKQQMTGIYANVAIVADPVFANVSGYLKLARRLWS